MPKITRHRAVRSLVLAILSILVPSASGLRAEFALPILYEVPKTVVVSERLDPKTFRRLAGVEDLTIEIRLEGGNMIRNGLISLLRETFTRARKRLVLRGPLTEVHVAQLRKIGQFEVAYEVDRLALDRETFNMLFALGPVRKHMIVPGQAEAALLAQLARLKYMVLHVRIGPEGLSDDLATWLTRRQGRGVCFELPLAASPGLIQGLGAYKPQRLVIPTRRNRIPPEILENIKDLNGVDLVIQVDDQLTLADVKALAVLERFSLRVRPRSEDALTPGLAQLLNQVRPPLRR